MERLTKKIDKSIFIEESEITKDQKGYSGEAIERLAKFENMFFDLLSKQEELSKELEKLRLVDKTKSVKFRQLLTDKLTNNNVLILLKSYGIY